MPLLWDTSMQLMTDHSSAFICFIIAMNSAISILVVDDIIVICQKRHFINVDAIVPINIKNVMIDNCTS